MKNICYAAQFNLLLLFVINPLRNQGSIRVVFCRSNNLRGLQIIISNY